MMKKKDVLSLFIWYMPVLVVQIIASFATINSLNPWYENLKKAAWNPPSYVFGPVWTILYLLMAVAIWMIFRTKKTQLHPVAYSLFFIQLLVNGLWSFLFFKYQLIFWAMIDLILLNILVAACTVVFFRIKVVAGYLFLPYLLWILYALSLNIAIFLKNPL